MPKTFNEVWEIVDKIYGAFSQFEAGKLYEYGKSLNQNSNVVEIGCYCGKSSTVLGFAVQQSKSHLTCIDNFITSAPDTKNVKKTFLENIKKNNIECDLMAMTSKEASEIYDKEIDLLFVDGDHLYSGTKLDCELWIPKVKIDGVVAFHDYKSSWEGVRQAVDEDGRLKIEALIESTAFTRRII